MDYVPNHIKEDIYETDKWAGLVHLQGGICDEKQRGINIKYLNTHFRV